MTLDMLVLRYNLDALCDEIEQLTTWNDRGQLDGLIAKKYAQLQFTASRLDLAGITDRSLRPEYV